MSRWIAPCIVALAAVSVAAPLHAQQPSPSTPSYFAPIPTPTVNPDMLKTPAVSPDADAAKADLNKPKALQRNKLTHTDVGGYDLQFKAGQRGLDSTSRQGWDSGEMSNAASVAGERPQRGFLGFRLSKPTN